MQRPGRGCWRMPASLATLAVAFVVVAGWWMSAVPAHADPHAVFYTAIGQQQLFFNILAALDQADYVEKAQGPNFSRESLADRREAANFGPADNPMLEATKTDLSSVITRLVTLEGHDLWSAYLLHSLAIESARRNGADELARVFCERGLGRIGCSTEAGPLRDKKEAFVTNALDWAADVGNAMVGIFQSGSDYDKQQRQQLADDNSRKEKKTRLWSSGMAGLRESAKTGPTADSIAQEKQAVERIAATGMNIEDGIDPSLFEGITFDQNGKAELAQDASSEQMFAKMNAFINLPQSVLSERIQAQEKMAAIQAAKLSPGAVADTHLQKKAAPDGTYREMVEVIDTPASAKVAMVNELAGTLSREVVDLKYANPESINNPQGVPLVERGAGNNQNAGAVNGIRSDTSGDTSTVGTGQGEVQGLMDIISAGLNLYEVYKYYDQEKTVPVTPDDNLIDPKLERGSRDALKALTNDTFRSGDPKEREQCGFCVNVQSIVQSIMSTVGGFICDIWPELPLCI